MILVPDQVMRSEILKVAICLHLLNPSDSLLAKNTLGENAEKSVEQKKHDYLFLKKIVFIGSTLSCSSYVPLSLSNHI